MHALSRTHRYRCRMLICLCLQSHDCVMLVLIMCMYTLRFLGSYMYIKFGCTDKNAKTLMSVIYMSCIALLLLII